MTKPRAVPVPNPATDTAASAAAAEDIDASGEVVATPAKGAANAAGTPAVAAAPTAPTAPAAPAAPAVRDPRREPRRGDLFRTSDGTLLRVGSASVMIGSDGVEQPSLSLDITSPKSAHTIAVLPFVTVRARVAKAEVLHRGPEVVDPWRTAVRTRESAPPYVYAPRPRGSER